MTNFFSAAIAKKAVLTTALAATAITGSLATATPAMADGYRGGHGHGGGLAIAAGILGLIGIAAIASSADHPREQAYAEPVYPGYGPASCYEAYPGYTGYCYPAAYYAHLGWAFHDGGWYDHDGHRYAHPYYNRGGYAGYGARMNGGGDHRGYNGGGQHEDGQHEGGRR